MKKLFTLTSCLLLTSCSLKQIVVTSTAGAVAIGAAVVGKSKLDNPETTKVIENIDTTGTIRSLGGMLVDDRHFLHVSHWPHKIGQTITLTGKDGKIVTRNIVSKTLIHDDLSIIEITPVDLNNHTLLPIAAAKLRVPTTVLRIVKEPFGTIVKAKSDKYLSLNPARWQINYGDSGKAWIQEQNGKHVVVGLTSTQRGTGPNLHKLYTEFKQSK